jgi:hypothetical protein
MHNARFTDQAHFHFEGVVRKQNVRFCASENPHLVTKKMRLAPKITVWKCEMYLLRSIYIGCGRLTLGFCRPQLNHTLGSNYATLVHYIYIYIYIYIYSMNLYTMLICSVILLTTELQFLNYFPIYI